MRFHAIGGLAFIAAAAFAACPANAAVSLFNSNGFESSAGYVAGTDNLGNQPSSSPANQQWDASKMGTVFGSVIQYAASTLQGVQLSVGTTTVNASADDYGYWYPRTYAGGSAFTPTAPATNVVNVNWTQYIASGATGSPFFGVSVFNGSNVVALAGFDANSGELVVQNPTGAIQTDAFVAAKNTYYNIQLSLDYSQQTYQVFVNSTLVGTESFATAATQFTDADLTTYVLGTGPANGSSIFDNYTVSAVPEPGMLSVAAMGALVALRRRREI